jgi:prepilin-type N-terminal cleavage/methylation domain-containing protein
MTAMADRSGFSLVELLVVIAIIALLVSVIMPSLASARELARACRVHAELNGLGMALELYAEEHDRTYPPVRVSCNPNLIDHYCRLPRELAEGNYVPGDEETGLAAAVEDEFHPGHTYKYATTGPQVLNSSPAGTFELWIPDDFPRCQSQTGSRQTGPETPVQWVLWSMGPRPDDPVTTAPEAPLGASTWYTSLGKPGVLVRFASKDGYFGKSP